MPAPKISDTVRTRSQEKTKGLAGIHQLTPVILGSPTWARTRDLRINSPALYRLSYRGTALDSSVVWVAVEGGERACACILRDPASADADGLGAVIGTKLAPGLTSMLRQRVLSTVDGNTLGRA